MKKAVFLDRDGTINEDTGFVHSIEDFILIPKSLEALRILSKTEYLIIIVSNAPAVGRGICTEKEYMQFHEKYMGLLRAGGARIDAAYYCFHHPQGQGKYKKDCECRKPGIGMIKQAQKDYGINLQESILIGDKRSDILAGKNAGCKTILVKTGYGGKGGEGCEVTPDYTAEDIYQAVQLIVTRQLAH